MPVSITPPRVPFLDERSGLISREWYRFLLQLFDSARVTESVVETVDKTPASCDVTAVVDLSVHDASLSRVAANIYDAILDAVTTQIPFTLPTTQPDQPITFNTPCPQSVVSEAFCAPVAGSDDRDHFIPPTPSTNYELGDKVVTGWQWAVLFGMLGSKHLIYDTSSTAIGIRIGENGPYYGFRVTGTDDMDIHNATGGDISFSHAGVKRYRFTSVGNLVGTAGATGMANGFVYIPAAAGPPTGSPTGYSGVIPLYYDTTNNRLYSHNGSWRSVAMT